MTERKKAAQEVDSGIPEPWKPETKGETIQGTYLGAQLMDGRGGRAEWLSYHLLTDPTPEHPEGRRRAVSSSMLTLKMARVPENTYIWLTYLGKFKAEKGESQDFKLEIEQGAKLLDPLHVEDPYAKARRARRGESEAE